MAYNSISIKPYIKTHLELQREITLIELVMKIKQILMKILRKQSVTDGRTHARTHARKDEQRENSIFITKKKFAGCIIN